MFCPFCLTRGRISILVSGSVVGLRQRDKRRTMKFCNHCGAKMEDGVAFCPQCGAQSDPSLSSAASGLPQSFASRSSVTSPNSPNAVSSRASYVAGNTGVPAPSAPPQSTYAAPSSVAPAPYNPAAVAGASPGMQKPRKVPIPNATSSSRR